MTETAVHTVESTAPDILDPLAEDRLDWLENQGREYGAGWLNRALFGAAMVLTVTIAAVVLTVGLLRHL